MSLQNKFKDKVTILIDGAQTHIVIFIILSKNIYVLSCPHKSLGLGMEQFLSILQ